MATNNLGRNIVFPIYNEDGTSFQGLTLRKSAYNSVVMSLGDTITGDVYYRNNSLVVTMREYIEYEGVRYIMVNPPTIIREGLVRENNDLKGMTKYSFTFYHPSVLLNNIAFSDVAVSDDETRYLSQNKTFAWIGRCHDLIDKLNKNLEGTQWLVNTSGNEESEAKMSVLSEVLSFDNNTIAEVLKKAYETWEVPFVVSSLPSTDSAYSEGKRFQITFGIPSQEIVDGDGNPFVFRFGQGVGLANNSRTPKNNKIVTRISGSGSSDNVPYGYPQILWTGDQTWSYTVNNDPDAANSYPIYDGIVGGAYVRLIKHPFQRTNLMPSIYSETVNKKVNPLADGYDPTIEIKDYYDAPDSYPNPINTESPSMEMHEFEDIKPELGEVGIVDAFPYYEEYDKEDYMTLTEYRLMLMDLMAQTTNEFEKAALSQLYGNAESESYTNGNEGGSYTYYANMTSNRYFAYVTYTSSVSNFTATVMRSQPPVRDWDDTIDEDGDYLQSYFKITLPVLDFDLYASAAITQEMQINMRSGSCLGCTFQVQVDWDDYKKNFYASDGTFAPDGEQRDLEKYPKSNEESITIIVKKDIETFGKLMPNIYQVPASGDLFVILGISLPTSYVTNAEARLDEAMMEYMLENNVHYYDYPLKFDNYFLANNTDILAQIRNNAIVRFQYAGSEMALYVKQISIKFGEDVLPQYDITLTDDVEIVLNQIGKVTDDVSRMRVEVSELQKYYTENLITAISSKLSKVSDDICQGRITFQQGLDSIGNLILHREIKSNNFNSGLYDGTGWKIDNLGNAELESLRIRSFFEVVELIINRMQAQEGDTLFTDNDQIEYVEKVVDETDQSVSYILSLKEKYDGYITGQMYGNVIKGIINTLAAKQSGVSGYDDSDAVEIDGSNTYYTSWMRVIATHATNANLGVNQIQVVLYGDDYVPSGKNFIPCQLMTIARWGCVDYSNPESEDYETVKASIVKRQRMFMISTTDGRVVKHTGVDAPILKKGNYGVTIGELPDFVKNYPDVASILEKVGEHSDWLYAQGIVVGNMVKIDKEGLPVPTIVFCGDWVDGSSADSPTPRNGIYYYNEYNEDTMQYEIHEVRHNGGRWQCLQHQPVTQGGVSVYHEPKWNSSYWKLVDGNDNLSIEFVSSKGYSFRRGGVNTTITPHLYYGNVDITEDVAAEYWTWTRESESGKTEQDEAWDAEHEQQKVLNLTNSDMPSTWSIGDKAIFTCTVVLNDGKTTRIVDNQIIS